MREPTFLQQNQARWQQYEQPSTNPDELAVRFVALTDDLAYAQTFYPDSPTTAYLNRLTTNLHQELYRTRREGTHRLLRFWADELPLLVARHHRTLAITALLFLVFAGIGTLSAAYDDRFVRLVLGDGYVNQTLENIRHGDPTAIYKSRSQADMFLSITFNNIMVALRTFVLGLTGGLGTLVILFFNGVMLGSFQYFFFQHGVGLTSALSIWIHGTLEISAIVLAGGAGLVMGSGLLFPGTYSRAAAFRQSARDGLQLALGLVPIFVLAGFLESFVTRYSGMPTLAKALIILLSAGFIIWYFGVYPRLVQRRQLPS